MNTDVSISEIVLRLIGAFYCFGSIVGVRMITRYSFLDYAIEAISGKKAPWAERFRERMMVAGLMPVFAGGLALMFLSPAAAWLFAVGSMWQALYLGWVAPRFLDPHDDPGEEGRAKTWRAFWGYLGATALVLAAAFTGLLRGPNDLVALGAGALVTAAFAAWSFWSMRNTLKSGGSPFTFGAGGDDPSEGYLSESGFKIREPDDISVILRPSWGDGALYAADTGHPVSWGWMEEYLSPSARELAADMNVLFRNIGDPYDPRRCALMNPADVTRIEEGAADALALLRQELGAERVGFEPLPAPVEPVMSADRVKIEPFDRYAVIWSLDEPVEQPSRPIDEDSFGISWSLARHLNQWSDEWCEEHDEEHDNDAHDPDAHDPDAHHPDAHDPDDPARPDAPPAPWTQADYDAHEECGRILAVRLKRELAATNRPHVMVYYPTRGAGLLEVHAGDEIPALPPPASSI